MKIRSFTVLPTIPESLALLLEIANNMWYGWHREATQLFRQLDKKAWRASGQTPVKLLSMIPPEKLEEAANNPTFVNEVETVGHRLRNYLEDETWYTQRYGIPENPHEIAYFCLEYGIHESLPIYSGGLGVLAGDHLKSASDLGLPLVAVGLLYREGYFRQYLNAEGMQQELYPENDWFAMPIQQVKDEHGGSLVLKLQMNGFEIFYMVWKAQVGRVTLFLLDTNLHENAPEMRAITNQLYASDRETRIRQEILLGVGGVRALKAMGINPRVYHCNEGHSAFLLLERVRHLMTKHDLTFDEARDLVWSTSVFTTHTPVPAGNENFSSDLVVKYFTPFAKEIGLEPGQFLRLGQLDGNEQGAFSMTVLALRFAAFANGVSQLHAKVSREMWKDMFPGIPVNEIPITHITNGVHGRSWMNPQFANLLKRYSSLMETNGGTSAFQWDEIEDVPDEELWKAHQFRKERLIKVARKHCHWQMKRRGASEEERSFINELLNSNVLTIGFARRFATYKRGTLILKNPERLKKMLTHATKPVQFIFAGKAHPADGGGKALIKEIFDFSSRPEVRHRILFLEDYDINIARYLVQGVDVWLNTPLRPQEASGTSGMKAAMNGALNLSIMDGWWDEAYTPDNGWRIGTGEVYDDIEFQNRIESDQLYRILEEYVIPLYYNRDASGIPLGWVQKMKGCLKSLAHAYSSNRMIMEYMNRFYARGLSLHETLASDGFKRTFELSAWHSKLGNEWNNVSVDRIDDFGGDIVKVGDRLKVAALIKLGQLLPENVIVEAYHGPLNAVGEIVEPFRTKMSLKSSDDSGHLFETNIVCKRGGPYGYTVRVLPGHKNLAVEILPGFIRWA